MLGAQFREMLLFLSPSRVTNPAALTISSVPRQVLGRNPKVRPKRRPFGALWWRLFFEHALSRYVVALAPFPIAMVIWPHLALPISQAPVLMFGIVLFIESNVLSVPTPARRRALISEADAGRGLDLLRVRATAALTRIAAKRDLPDSTLHLVVEQSAMARVEPLTFVSVQSDGPVKVFLELDDAEEAFLRETLFADPLDERALLKINLADNLFLRSVPLPAGSVSAHARLAAMGREQQRAETI